ncbi:hypothetical protein [Aeromonas sp. R6-2]|uniref:hypothetical protein n=1 Tax=unclassified Aeromonas TaxID=257493 RepID=UPI0034A484E0
MYIYIFESKLITVLLGFLYAYIIIALFSGVKKAFGYSIRLFLFSYSSILPIGFLTAALFSELQINKFDVLASIYVEIITLFFVALLFCKFIMGFDYRKISCEQYDKYIFLFSVLVLVTNLPLLLSSSYGIFSNSSRVSYLSENASYKYFTYASFLFIFFTGVLISKRLQVNSNTSSVILLFLFLVFLLSVLSGSKGMFFLILFQIVSIIDYKKFRPSKFKILIFTFFFISLFLFSMVFISEFIGITYSEFVNLIFNRFFLVNDARALAFDYRYTITDPSLSMFLKESFRSYAALLGEPPVNPPIGNYLYGLMNGVTSSNGANASLVSLAVLYSEEGGAIFNLFFISFIPFCIFLFVLIVLNIERFFIRRLFVVVSSIVCLLQYSQDFLSFQLLLYIFLLIYLSWVIFSCFKCKLLKNL